MVTKLILDTGDGVELIHHLRKESQLDHSLIFVLSDQEESYAEVTCLNAGADDYLRLPFRNRVFESRLDALLRRSRQFSNYFEPFEKGMASDGRRFTVKFKGKSFQVPRKEYEIFNLLMSQPGKVFSRQAIIDHVWHKMENVRERTVDVHIRKLRVRVGADIVKTIKGVGYKISA